MSDSAASNEEARNSGRAGSGHALITPFDNAAYPHRMTRQGKFEHSAHTLAAMLAEGAEAAVVGDEFLKGTTEVWLDEEMQTVWHQRKAANGVYVRWPGGRTAMFVTDKRDAAESLLARAQEIASNV